jgi:dephospho-CoA kinase
MIVLGLTGSIGMGKSTTANMFRDLGIAVHDADAVVHELYAGKAIDQIEAAFPGVVTAGKVDRQKLSVQVVGPQNADAMKTLEAIIHPMVREAETAFLSLRRKNGDSLVVLDIPLLFETGRNEQVDYVLVVTAPTEVQEQRVLNRPGMTEDKFRAILSRQTPDAEKRDRADFVFDTSQGLDATKQNVKALVEKLTKKA